MPKHANFETPPLGANIQPLIDSAYEFTEAGVKKGLERSLSHRAAGKVLLSLQ